MLNVRKDFPYLERTVNGKPIVYMDSAATAQKPRQVMNRILDLYSSGLSNVHRAVNFLAEEVTQAFEGGRETVARFIGAQTREIIFTYKEAEKKYGISDSRFGKAIDELIEKGFIDIADTGMGVHKVTTLYSISDRWKLYGTKDFVKKERAKGPINRGFQKGNQYGRNCRKKKKD